VAPVNAHISSRRRGVLLAPCATALAAAWLAVAPTAGAQLRTVTLRVPLPRQVTEPGRGVLGRRSLAGEIHLQVPADWARLHSTQGRTTAKLSVKLAPGCEAKIEVQAGADTFTNSVEREIQEAIFFVFSPSGHGPFEPLPVAIIAKHVSAHRAWELVGAPPGRGTSVPVVPGEPPVRELKPLYGVEVQRIAAPNTWASLTVSPWVPAACLAHLPRRAYLQSAIESMLASASFHAHIGPRLKH